MKDCEQTDSMLAFVCGFLFIEQQYRANKTYEQVIITPPAICAL